MKSAAEVTRVRAAVPEIGMVARPLLRALAFSAALVTAAFVPLLVSAERGFGLGRMSAGAPAELFSARSEGARRVALNGVELWLETQTLDEPLESVLAHHQSICGVRPSAPVGAWGHVACVGAVKDESLLGLVGRLSSFAESGDLADLGGLRVAFARRVTSHDGPATFLLTMWTDSSLHVASLVPPAEGDAPGRDPRSMPRPRSSQRVLSAAEVDAPSGVFVYRVEGLAPESVAEFYRRELPATGWRLLQDPSARSLTIGSAHVVSAERDGVLLTVVSHASEVSGVVLTVLTAKEPS